MGNDVGGEHWSLWHSGLEIKQRAWRGLIIMRTKLLFRGLKMFDPVRASLSFNRAQQAGRIRACCGTGKGAGGGNKGTGGETADVSRRFARLGDARTVRQLGGCCQIAEKQLFKLLGFWICFCEQHSSSRASPNPPNLPPHCTGQD